MTAPLRSHDACRATGQPAARWLARPWTALLAALLATPFAGCDPAPDCRVRQVPTAQAAPSAGDGLVSVDTLLWLRVEPLDGEIRCLVNEVALVDLDEGQVDIDHAFRVDSPGRVLSAWEPAAPLRPNADHELRWTANDGTGSQLTGVVSFRTADADYIPPAPLPPTPVSWYAQLDGPRLGVDAADAVDFNDSLSLWLDGGRFVLMEPASGVVDDAPDEVPDEVFRIGTRGYIWSGEPLPAGRTVEYRYASVALDGTVSEWGPPVPFAVPLPRTADEGVFE